MSVEFTTGLIKLQDIDRVISIERQELRRMGLDDDQVDGYVPEASELESDIKRHPGSYLGMYAASELIAFANTGKWTPDDDIPFARNNTEKMMLRISGVLGRHVMDYPMGIFRLGVDQDLDEVSTYRATHGILSSLTRTADFANSNIFMTVYNPAENPSVQPLRDWNFIDTGQHISLENGTVRSAKYFRPKRTSGGRGRAIKNPIVSPEPRTAL
jgi:hypothetical protein